MTREEAINRIKERLSKEAWCTDETDIEALCEIIPELKESEDERMRKAIWLVLVATEEEQDAFYRTHNITRKECTDWLEKQKAKERYDRMAPIYEDKESFESALDKAWRFYNDSGSSTVDGCEDNAFELAFSKGFREGFLCREKQKEHRLAFTWRRVEDVTTKRTDEGDCVTTEKMLVKGLIDDEDYRIIDKDVMVNGNLLCIPVRELNAEQKSAEWSEEDETCLEYALWCVMKTRHFVAKDACDLDACRCAERWLEFLPERFNLKPKQEWSEEDERMRQHIISDLREFRDCETDEELISDYEDEIAWLKSLRPQPSTVSIRNANKFAELEYERGVKDGLNYHWKPSEEQISALERAIVKMHTPDDIGILAELRDNLKKL